MRQAYGFLSVNLRITTQPLAVAIPRNAQDVANVVRVAAKHNYKVTVKSGGVSNLDVIPDILD